MEVDIAGREVKGSTAEGVTGLNIAGGGVVKFKIAGREVINKGVAGLDVAGDEGGGNGKGGIIAGRRFLSFRFGLLRRRGPEKPALLRQKLSCGPTPK